MMFWHIKCSGERLCLIHVYSSSYIIKERDNLNVTRHKYNLDGDTTFVSTVFLSFCLSFCLYFLPSVPPPSLPPLLSFLSFLPFFLPSLFLSFVLLSSFFYLLVINPLSFLVFPLSGTLRSSTILFNETPLSSPTEESHFPLEGYETFFLYTLRLLFPTFSDPLVSFSIRRPGTSFESLLLFSLVERHGLFRVLRVQNFTSPE